ncbi:MAG: TIGR03089 family protein, partial [Actinomadura sp.]
QTAVWLFACWSAGLVARPVGPDVTPDVEADIEVDIAVVAEELLPVPAVAARDVVGLSLHALGRPLADPPAGVVDYAVEVRSYGDHFVPYTPVDPDGPALDVANDTFTAAELVRLAHDAAREWGLDARTRVLADMPYITVNMLLSGLLAPLSANGSVIIQRNLDESSLERRITLEHVTAVAGVPGWDERTGPVRRLL